MNPVRKFFTEVTAQVFELWKVNRELERGITLLQERKPQPNYDAPQYPVLDSGDLLRHLSQEQARRQIIEDKAKTNILGITLAFSVVLASVALSPRIAELGKTSGDWVTWVLMVFMAFQLVGIGFLLLGGWLALKTLGIARGYFWSLQDERRVTTAPARNAEILWYVENIQLGSLLKSNFLDTSYNCIRNGVIALAISAVLVLTLLAVQILNSQPDVEPERKTNVEQPVAVD